LKKTTGDRRKEKKKEGNWTVGGAANGRLTLGGPEGGGNFNDPSLERLLARRQKEGLGEETMK